MDYYINIEIIEINIILLLRLDQMNYRLSKSEVSVIIVEY